MEKRAAHLPIHEHEVYIVLKRESLHELNKAMGRRISVKCLHPKARLRRGAGDFAQAALDR